MSGVYTLAYYFHLWFSNQDRIKQLFLFFMLLSFVWIIFKGLSSTMKGFAGRLGIHCQLAAIIITAAAFIGGFALTYRSFALTPSHYRNTLADVLFCGFILEIMLVFGDDLIRTGLFEPNRYTA